MLSLLSSSKVPSYFTINLLYEIRHDLVSNLIKQKMVASVVEPLELLKTRTYKIDMRTKTLERIYQIGNEVRSYFIT